MLFSGFTFAFCSSRLLLLMMTEGNQQLISLNLTPDVRVLSLTVALAILTALLFGFVPAWHCSRKIPLPCSSKTRAVPASVDLQSRLRSAGEVNLLAAERPLALKKKNPLSKTSVNSAHRSLYRIYVHFGRGIRPKATCPVIRLIGRWPDRCRTL